MSNYAVVCRTCFHNVYEADTPPVDGQVLLTAYADSVPGTACPTPVDPCPHKSAAIAVERRQRPAAILARLAVIEAKLGITPASQA